ncbi:hypothetical protein BDV12DRAFT_179133 [Aspergillus spectabilis]
MEKQGITQQDNTPSIETQSASNVLVLNSQDSPAALLTGESGDRAPIDDAQEGSDNAMSISSDEEMATPYTNQPKPDMLCSSSSPSFFKASPSDHDVLAENTQPDEVVPSVPMRPTFGQSRKEGENQHTLDSASPTPKQIAPTMSPIPLPSTISSVPPIRKSTDEISLLAIPGGIHLPKSAEGLVSGQCNAALYHLISLHSQVTAKENSIRAHREHMAALEREGHTSQIQELKAQNSELHEVQNGHVRRIQELEANNTELQQKLTSSNEQLQTVLSLVRDLPGVIGKHYKDILQKTQEGAQEITLHIEQLKAQSSGA